MDDTAAPADPQAPDPAPDPTMEPPRSRYDVERVRFSGERNAAAAVRADAWLKDLVIAAEARGTPDPKRVRRSLLSRSVMLTEGMAPDAWQAARAAAEALGVTRELELYQAAGAENAGIHLVDSPVLMEIRGRLLSLLDAEATTCVFGHELGHWLAHGPTSPDGPLGMVVWAALELSAVPEHAQRHVSVLSMAREITADRFGLLATRDLDAALRLEMATTTGLSAGELTWDTQAYLAQCTALVEDMQAEGGQAMGTTHPEHGLRAWALWLWSETDVYKELTGLGPGTRTAEDVDAAIAKVLGAAPAQGLTESALVLDPIPEVHECALASAALVALADNELSEAETLAIEGVFAHLVDDWQRYLVWDNALEAFADTGAVVIRGGASTQRAVFQVLVHVLAADGKVEKSEIEMVCSIGDALRCGTLYRALLTPVLRALGEEVPDLSQVERPIPMPARADEAEAALEIFLRGMLRRRGGEATPRRLYQLLGDAEGTEQSRETIHRLLREIGLEIDGELEDAPRDRPLSFEPTAEALARLEAEEKPPPPDIGEPARIRLTTALTRLRDQLVSGDGRSPSIRLRRCRTGRSFDLHALEGLSLGHAERTLTLVQSGAPARIVDGKEVGVHEGAAAVSKELVSLEREALARTEQTGARDLYLGAPFLTGVFHGYLVRAPLLLHPVDLERSKGRGFKMVPRPDDPPVANQALVRLLFSKKGVSFPDDLGDTLDKAAEEGLEALRAVLSDHGIVARPEAESLQALVPRDEAFATWPNGRVVLEPCAVLGFFPQSSSDMIQDYDALLAAIADPSEDLAARFGAAGALLPADLREALGVAAPPTPEAAPLVPVVPADPSQRAVLTEARGRRALVVDGPPGTGKSQVIVNLVTDALARGESVAVVCEKRAALDVVAQRLEQVGLRHLLALVHDAHDDRRGLYDQVLRRLGEGALRDHDDVKATRVEEDLAQVEQALSERRAALATALGEETPTLGQLHLLASSFTTPPLEGLDPSVARLPLDTVRRLAGRLSREARNVDLHVQGSPWRPPEGATRPSLADASNETLHAVEEALRGARETAAGLDRLRQAQGVADAACVAASGALKAAVAGRESRAAPAGKQATAAWLRLAEEPALDAMVANLEKTWAATADWSEATPERAAFEGSPELETALTVAEGWGSQFFRFFSLAWWNARGLIKRTVLAQWPAAAAAGFGPRLLQRVRHRQAGAAAWKALDKVLAALQLAPVLPDTDAANAQVEVLLATWQATRPVVAAKAALTAAGAWPGPGDADLSAWDAALDDRLAIVSAARAHARALGPARQWLPWLPETADQDTVAALHEAWSLDAARVVAADRNLDAAATLHPDARPMTLALADALPDAGEVAWEEAVQHGHAVRALQAVERRHPGTRVLDRATPVGEVEEAEARLAELVDQRAVLHVSRILAERDRVPLLTEARPEKGARRTVLQKAREQMLREASKKRYVLSLRGFVRQFAGSGLMGVLPVWLVSPETMAVLFPGQPVFDLVVMDEASQATVEKGLPALVRGHRAVVAGDERQMPPSRFFELRTPGEDEIGTAETVEADALTAESLLVLARERCHHAGLRWHYRCLHEELIAFSNHAMYGGGLFTIPSTATPDAAPALRWVQVEDGQYDRGGNPVEAERVVDLVAELLAEHHPPSIGVVTFNIQQRRIILDALDRRAETDEAFGLRYAEARSAEAMDQRPFVKNLESVQGDERDIIIFSLGHAPVERKSGPLKGQPYVPARFGPLGQIGGERRLNVAVSRAKRACVIVASFTPNMLSVATTKHEGPKLLKAFLEFAWDLTHGRRRQADKTLERVRSGSLGADRRKRLGVELRVPSLAAQIALALEDEGVGYDLDVGTSGFRVPLALRDPAMEKSWRVAVLTEEGHEPGDVDEAHRHAPGVLRARGWQVERVDARTWHKDPAAVVARLVAALGEGERVPEGWPD
jgi:RecA/RadA recombinase